MLLAIPMPHCDGGCGYDVVAFCRITAQQSPRADYIVCNFVASADHMLSIYTVHARLDDVTMFSQQKNVT